jgi:hypothetical protein
VPDCGHAKDPKLAVAGSARTGWVKARATSTLPAPWAKPVASMGLALSTSADFSSGARQSGCAWASSAAAPATCRAAIEVPDSLV